MTIKTKNKFVQSFKIWIAIYPSITLINVAFGEWLSALAIYVRTFLLTIFLVPWMIFVLLPFINVQARKILALLNNSCGADTLNCIYFICTNRNDYLTIVKGCHLGKV